MRVLVFGASITQGFWDTEGGWVQRLRSHYDKLNLKNSNRDQPTIFNLGISGEMTSGLLKRFTNETEARVWPNEKFTFIFSIGTNDAAVDGTDKLHSTPERFRNDLEALVEQAKKYSDRIMFVGLIACAKRKRHP